MGISDKYTEQTYICHHCGNESVMSDIGSYKRFPNIDDNDELYEVFEHHLLECPMCHKPLLLSLYRHEFMQIEASDRKLENYAESRIEYPRSRLGYKNTPQEIRESFETAIRVKGFDKKASLISLRLTIELVLGNKGETRGSLHEKIRKLTDSGVLPEVLSEISDVTRLFGNSAAHDKSVEVNEVDLDLLIEFTEYLLDYLYVIPAHIKRLKEKISPRE
jgi:hypothetical protein